LWKTIFTTPCWGFLYLHSNFLNWPLFPLFTSYSNLL
jgi:hypothetical protein